MMTDQRLRTDDRDLARVDGIDLDEGGLDNGVDQPVSGTGPHDSWRRAVLANGPGRAEVGRRDTQHPRGQGHVGRR